MKLSRALKEKKRLAAEIAHLKNKISSKNSYLQDSGVEGKFPVPKLLEQLNKKVEELITLKFIINEANKEIQSAIYTLGEHKGMINFVNGINTNEGPQLARFAESVQVYEVQIDEVKRDEMVVELQGKADRLQDHIDEYNHTTDIPWGDEMPPMVENENQKDESAE